MTGLKSTYTQVASANGPAQMLTYGFWGIIVAGMFYGVDPSCFPDWMILAWGITSAIVIPITIWGSKELLKFTLLFDTVFSAYILTLLMMHNPHPPDAVYYINAAYGFEEASRSVMMSHDVSEWFHGVALLWMSFHSIYLANLTHRQILEKKRFG